MKKFLCVLVLLASQGPIKSQGTILNYSDIPDSLIESSNAVVLYDDTKIVFKSYDLFTEYHNCGLTILNNNGSNHLSFRAYYKEGSEKVSKIQINIYDKNGKLIKSAKDKDVEDMIASDGISMISDQRLKYWSYDSGDYPISISYSYQIESKNTLLLPTWRPILGNDISVMRSTYALETTQIVKKKELNLDKYSSIESKENEYIMSFQKSLNYEKYAPAESEIFPTVYFSPQIYSFEGVIGTFDSWDGYADWIYQNFLIKDDQLQDTKILTELDSLISHTDSEIDIISKLYQYLQKNTRYISIALNDGGLNPMPAPKVHQVKYGDCKALSYYLKSLLAIYNIKSNYTEVHADSDHKIGLYPDFPGPIPGNHIILNIPLENDTIWLDCTSSLNPMNYLGSFTDDRNVIIIEEGKGTIVKTPKYGSTDNLTSTYSNIEIRDDGAIHLKSEKIYKGLNIEKILGLNKLTTEEIKDYLKEKRYQDLNNIAVQSTSYSLSEYEPIASETIDIRFDRHAEISGNYLFVPLSFEYFDIPTLPKDKVRVNPIEFTRGTTYKSELKIKMPEGYKSMQCNKTEIKSKYGYYTSECIVQHDGQISINKAFILNEGTYLAEEYNDIKKFMDQCLKIERTPLALEKK